MLGVHANTVRSWTDQGVLTCLRINQRGDRRYARQEIARFLAQTDSPAPAVTAQTGNAKNGRRRDGTYQAALPYGDGQEGGGVVLLSGTAATRNHDEPQLLAAVAAQLEVAVALSRQLEKMSRRQHRAEMLLSIDDDLSARRDPERVLRRLVENAVQAFGAQHAGVFLGAAEGTFQAKVTHNLSAEFCQVLEHATHRPLTAAALAERRVVTVTDYPDDPRLFELRTAIRREGFTASPLPRSSPRARHLACCACTTTSATIGARPMSRCSRGSHAMARP